MYDDYVKETENKNKWHMLSVEPQRGPNSTPRTILFELWTPRRNKKVKLITTRLVLVTSKSNGTGKK